MRAWILALFVLFAGQVQADDLSYSELFVTGGDAETDDLDAFQHLVEKKQALPISIGT